MEIVYLGDPELVAGRLGTGDRDDRESFDFGPKPNPSDPLAAPCTTVDIVARALDGRVLARIPPPVGRLVEETANCTDSGATPPGDDDWTTCAGGGTHDAATNVVTTYASRCPSTPGTSSCAE